MRVLLTGATGFIGSHILEELVARGDRVRVLALPETVEQLQNRDNVELLEGSLTDSNLLDLATRDVHVVYHVAGQVPGTRTDKIIDINVHGTENLLRASVRSTVSRFVFTSSIAVYDPWLPRFGWPITEDDQLINSSNLGLASYPQSKRDAENLIHRYHRTDGLGYVILRSPIVYGPGARRIEWLLSEVMKRPRLALPRVGKARRMQWINIIDMVHAVILAGTEPKAVNNTFNIAGGELFSLRDILEIVYGNQGRSHSSNFSYDEMRGALNHPLLKYDYGKAQELLGYKPRVSLREGIEQMLLALGNERSSNPRADQHQRLF
jgi:nucleoside-diphosphate-sugar epimerase